MGSTGEAICTDRAELDPVTRSDGLGKLELDWQLIQRVTKIENSSWVFRREQKVYVKKLSIIFR